MWVCTVLTRHASHAPMSKRNVCANFFPPGRGDRRTVTPELFRAGSQAVPWQMCFEEFWGMEIRITKNHSPKSSYTGLAQRGEEKMCQYSPYLWKVHRVSAACCILMCGLSLTGARVAVLPLKSYSERPGDEKGFPLAASLWDTTKSSWCRKCCLSYRGLAYLKIMSMGYYVKWQKYF